MGLALQSAQAYDYLKGVFEGDWQAGSLRIDLSDDRRRPD
jgi:hypothetical protein